MDIEFMNMSSGAYAAVAGFLLFGIIQFRDGPSTGVRSRDARGINHDIHDTFTSLSGKLYLRCKIYIVYS